MTSRTVSSGSTAHRLSAMGLLVTLGIVYGDIGTSPLYVMKAITGATSMVTADYIIGAVSCIIWTLTLPDHAEICGAGPARRQQG